MKRFILHAGCVAAVAAFMLVAVGCKTSEENYRRAYDVAKQKQVESAGGETIYNAIRREATGSETVVNGDSIRLRSEYVTVTKDCAPGPKALKRYNVVVGQFKQLFHARSLMTRMKDAGYESTFVAQTREPYYYVIAVASDSVADIVPAFHLFETKSPIRLVDPCPWILQPVNR